jgi:hypothetical protein
MVPVGVATPTAGRDAAGRSVGTASTLGIGGVGDGCAAIAAFGAGDAVGLTAAGGAPLRGTGWIDT